MGIYGIIFNLEDLHLDIIVDTISAYEIHLIER